MPVVDPGGAASLPATSLRRGIVDQGSRAPLVDEFPDIDVAGGNGVLSHESLEPFDCGGGMSGSRGFGQVRSI